MLCSRFGRLSYGVRPVKSKFRVKREKVLYIPNFAKESDLSVLVSHIQKYPFATWSVISAGEICVNHLPFIYSSDGGRYGTLRGHVARENKVWELLSETESVVSFLGEQSYISPSFYPSKSEHGKVVPTWNYVAVQAKGIATAVHDGSWLLSHLQELTTVHESTFEVPWRVSDAPEKFIERLIGAIVGIEIPITSIAGKWKLGQSRPLVDRQGMVEELKKLGKVEMSKEIAKSGSSA